MRTLPAVLALLLLAVPALADGGPTDAEARAAIRAFRKAFAAEEMDARMQALWDLSRVKHAKVVAEIGMGRSILEG